MSRRIPSIKAELPGSLPDRSLLILITPQLWRGMHYSPAANDFFYLVQPLLELIVCRSTSQIVVDPFVCNVGYLLWCSPEVGMTRTRSSINLFYSSYIALSCLLHRNAI